MITTQPRGTWIDESLIDHNLLLNTHNLTTDIDHTLIQNVGINSHAIIDSFITNVPVTYLKLDASNDPITGVLTLQSDLQVQGGIYGDNIYELTGAANITIHNHIFPGASGIDFGDISNPFRSIFLDNNSGKIIDCTTAIGTTARTAYTFDLGGGGNVATEGGDFVFQMDPCVGACENNIIFDVGNVYWAGAGFFNRFKIQSFTGLRTYAFVAAFGGFNNVNYGWELQYISGLANTAKTLFFDNQSAAGVARSLDFRINTINKLTIENDGTVAVVDRITTPELTATVINNGFQIGTVAVPGVSVTAFGNFFGLNWFDYLTINAVTTNLPSCLGMFPNGTGTASYVNAYNSSNTGATAWLEMGVRGSIAELVVRDFAQTTNITDLNIGSGGNDFPVFDVTCTTLTDINFIFAGLTELTIQPDTLIFNNGAVDTQIDWGTNGELGFQVAATDIIRISTTLAHIYQNTDIDGDVWLTSDNDRIYLGTGKDWDFYYDGTYGWIRTDLQNPSDLRLDCGTDKTLELQETVWKDINIGGVNLTRSVANQPGQVTIDATSIITYAFDGVAFVEELSGAFELQHDYKEGTDIIPHIHWYPTTAGAGNVKWQLEYWIRINNTVKLTGIITVTDAASGTAWTEERADFPAITGTNLLINAQIHFRLFRDPTDGADTYAADAAIGTIGIHYEIDTIGSRQTIIK